MVPSPAPEGTANGASLLTSNQLQSDIFKVDPKPTITSMEPTATERLQRLMRDCGYSTARLENMYSELPPRKLRDDLLDYYFSNMSVLAFVLDEWNHLLMNLTGLWRQHACCNCIVTNLTSNYNASNLASRTLCGTVERE